MRILTSTSAVAMALAATATAHAQTRVQAATGVQYSTGEFGELTQTDAFVVPFSARVSFGALSLRASIPYIHVDGPADVTEIVDDSGGSNSGSGSSGSGSSGSGSSGSGSSGSGDSNDDDGSSGGSAGGIPIAARDEKTSGMADLTLAATYAFNSIANSPIYLDLTGRVRLPTGNEKKGLSTGATDYFALTEIGWDGAAGGVFVGGGRRFLGDANGVERKNGWQASAGGWLNVSRATVFGAYYDWRNSSVSGGQDPSSIEAYVSWRMNESWKIELNGGAGLSDASADYSVGMTLVWRTR